MSDEHDPSESEAEEVDRTVEGWDVDDGDPEALWRAVEEAADYRGDVTVYKPDGSCEEGYVFDYRGGEKARLRLLRKADNSRATVPWAETKRIVFSGKDTAFGRSWDAWMRKYEKLKAEGKPTDRYPQMDE